MNICDLPRDVWYNKIVPFLNDEELLILGAVSKSGRGIRDKFFPKRFTRTMGMRLPSESVSDIVREFVKMLQIQELVRKLGVQSIFNDSFAFYSNNSRSRIKRASKKSGLGLVVDSEGNLDAGKCGFLEKVQGKRVAWLFRFLENEVRHLERKVQEVFSVRPTGNPLQFIRNKILRLSKVANVAWFAKIALEMSRRTLAIPLRRGRQISTNIPLDVIKFIFNHRVILSGKELVFEGETIPVELAVKLTDFRREAPAGKTVFILYEKEGENRELGRLSIHLVWTFIEYSKSLVSYAGNPLPEKFHDVSEHNIREILKQAQGEEKILVNPRLRGIIEVGNHLGQATDGKMPVFSYLVQVAIEVLSRENKEKMELCFAAGSGSGIFVAYDRGFRSQVEDVDRSIKSQIMQARREGKMFPFGGDFDDSAKYFTLHKRDVKLDEKPPVLQTKWEGTILPEFFREDLSKYEAS